MKIQNKLTIWTVAFAAVFYAVAGGLGGTRSQNATPTAFTLKPIPISAVHHSWLAPRIRNKNGTSANWSGYAVYPLAQNSSMIETTKGKGNNGKKPGATSSPTFSAVTGSWVVPLVAASDSANTYSSSWVGLDGYDNNTVEQIGIEQDWSNGSPEYYAWFEMYPKWAYMIDGFPVNPDDTITANVVYVSKGKFTLTIVNTTELDTSGNPTTFSITQRAPSALRLSAEWIEEAPWSGGVLPLADFGTIDFSDCYATMNGEGGAIDDSRWQYDAITMGTSDGSVKAEPSNLSPDGMGFSVTWYGE